MEDGIIGGMPGLVQGGRNPFRVEWRLDIPVRIILWMVWLVAGAGNV